MQLNFSFSRYRISFFYKYMEHQDWTPIVINNKNAQQNYTKTIQARVKGNQVSKKLLDNDFTKEEKKYSKDFIKKVKAMRGTYEEINTQEKMAQKLQVNKSIISQLEMGVGYSGELINKINQLEKRLEKNTLKK